MTTLTEEERKEVARLITDAVKDIVINHDPHFSAEDDDHLDDLQGAIGQLLKSYFDRLTAQPAAPPIGDAMGDKNHPEMTCEKCGGPNVIWFVDNATWNRVVGSPNGIWCPVCFALAAQAAGVYDGPWRLSGQPAAGLVDEDALAIKLTEIRLDNPGISGRELAKALIASGLIRPMPTREEWVAAFQKRAVQGVWVSVETAADMAVALLNGREG